MLRYQNANRERSPVAKRSGEEAWLVVELFRRRFDAIPSRLRYGSAGNVVQNNGDSRGIQAQMSREFLQAGGLFCLTGSPSRLLFCLVHAAHTKGGEFSP